MRAMPQTKTAVVVGALGVIGRYIVDKLAGLPDWQVVGLSRRRGEDRARLRYVSVDLGDARDAAAKLKDLGEATHVFYCAFQASGTQAADYARGTAANLALLENSVRPIDAVAKGLERVVLVTGTKYYGSHLGPFKTPAREDDPRHMPPDFYFDQIDWLTDFQRGRRWSWTELRPQTLCGFAPGTPMSIVPVIAVYAAISKALGLPLRFPGKPGAYRAIYQVTDSAHLANAFVWAALDCPAFGAWERSRPKLPALLGRISATVVRPVRVGDQTAIIAWPLAADGRKLYSASALFAADGSLSAYAATTWIVLR